MIKQMMIDLIRQHLYYEKNVLEDMTEEEVREIYESLIDFIG